MLVYSNEKFIKAHENTSISYRNHSYDRHVRDAICANCGTVLGEQVKYFNIDKQFYFGNAEMRNWKYCPYCSEKLY